MAADVAGTVDVDESIHGGETPPGDHQRRLSGWLHTSAPRRWRTRQSASHVAQCMADAGHVTQGCRAAASGPLGDRHRRVARPDLPIDVARHTRLGQLSRATHNGAYVVLERARISLSVESGRPDPNAESTRTTSCGVALS